MPDVPDVPDVPAAPDEPDVPAALDVPEAATGPMDAGAPKQTIPHQWVQGARLASRPLHERTEGHHSPV